MANTRKRYNKKTKKRGKTACGNTARNCNCSSSRSNQNNQNNRSAKMTEIFNRNKKRNRMIRNIRMGQSTFSRIYGGQNTVDSYKQAGGERRTLEEEERWAIYNQQYQDALQDAILDVQPVLSTPFTNPTRRLSKVQMDQIRDQVDTKFTSEEMADWKALKGKKQYRTGGYLPDGQAGGASPFVGQPWSPSGSANTGNYFAPSPNGVGTGLVPILDDGQPLPPGNARFPTQLGPQLMKGLLGGGNKAYRSKSSSSKKHRGGGILGDFNSLVANVGYKMGSFSSNLDGLNPPPNPNPYDQPIQRL